MSSNAAPTTQARVDLPKPKDVPMQGPVGGVMATAETVLNKKEEEIKADDKYKGSGNFSSTGVSTTTGKSEKGWM